MIPRYPKLHKGKTFKKANYRQIIYFSRFCGGTNTLMFSAILYNINNSNAIGHKRLLGSV